jgi:L-alanine-DL-glutamate epimerase-like enolase superfamily enzyme
MKITSIRTRVVQWTGPTVPLPPHFCTNPMDVLAPMLARHAPASMSIFTFHGWLICEIMTDTGLVGIGNAALAPRVTKEVIDLYLKPLLLGADPWDIEFLWQHMYRKTMAFGRKGIAMVAISAVDIALWDLLGKSAKQPVYRLLGGRTKPRIPVYASRLYSTPLDELAHEALKYKNEGYQALKLRFGWGPVDGAAGMQKNIALVRTVRETVGDGVDVMADAYMGWTLDYAKRMLPLLEPYNLRWLEEPVIPDDIHGYAELKRAGRVPIAGGEHEHTLYGFRELLEARAVDVIQFDTNRVGGLTQARKIAALAEAHSVPVIPHAGQMHNYHVVMASLNSPMAEFFPPVEPLLIWPWPRPSPATNWCSLEPAPRARSPSAARPAISTFPPWPASTRPRPTRWPRTASARAPCRRSSWRLRFWATPRRWPKPVRRRFSCR